MAALTAERLVNYMKIDPNSGGVIIEYDVLAAAVIFKGAFVSIQTGGYIGPVGTGTGVEPVLGYALESKTGGATDGLIRCRVLIGAVIELVIAGLTLANIGDAVYALDNDNELTTTGTTNQAVGHIIGVKPGTTTTFFIKMAWPGQPAT